MGAWHLRTEGAMGECGHSPGEPGAPAAVRQEEPSPGASEGAWLCDTLISDFWLQTRHTLLLLPPSAVLRSGSPQIQHCTCTLSLSQNSGRKWAAWAYRSEGVGKTPQSDTPLGTTLPDAVSKQSGVTCCEKGREGKQGQGRSGQCAEPERGRAAPTCWGAPAAPPRPPLCWLRSGKQGDRLRVQPEDSGV